MARRHENDAGEKGSLIDRRSYLRLAGAVGAAATAGLTGSALGDGDGDVETTIDADQVVALGEEGLEEGDVIDPYLDQYFQNGVEVRIPEGEYDWEGGAFGGASRNAAIVGEGAVILQTVDSRFHNNIRARGGTLEFRNLTIRGAVRNESRMRVETDDDGRIIVDNVDFPDGSVDDTGRAQAWYTPREHAGRIEFHDCYARGFSDNGFYVSSSGAERDGQGGQVVIDSCVAHNNNISGFRIGGIDSAILNSVVINDGRSPVPSGISHNQRGIRIDNSAYSKNIRVENCDIIHSGSTSELGNGGPMRWSPRAHDSTGHIENVRILNNVDIAAIGPRRDATHGWSGNEIHVSGNGDMDVPSWFTNVYVGEDAEEPTGSVAGNSKSELVIVTDDSDGIEYEFYATEEIVPQYDRYEYNANLEEPMDYAEQLEDGTWRAHGFTSGGATSGDSFRFDGEITGFNVAGDADAMVLYLDGLRVTLDELVVDDPEKDPENGDDEDGESGDGGDEDEPDEGTDEESDADDETELVIVTDNSGGIEYEFTASGEVTPLYDRDEYPANTTEPADEAWENDDGTWTGHGYTSGSGHSGDSFAYAGDLLSFDADGDVEAMTLYADGEEVTAEDLVVDDADDDGSDGEAGSGDDGTDDPDDSEDGSDGGEDDGQLPNILIVDGTISEHVTSYTFTVTGEVERYDAVSSVPADALPWDDLEDTVEDGAVTGIVGKAIDGYRYSGDLVDVEFDGVAAITVESVES